MVSVFQSSPIITHRATVVRTYLTKREKKKKPSLGMRIMRMLTFPRITRQYHPS